MPIRTRQAAVGGRTSSRVKYRLDTDEYIEPETEENRLSRLLQTNELPTEADRAHFDDLLEKKSAELLEKEAQMRRLQAEIVAIKHEKAQYACIVSVTRAIPPEILSYIFLLCIPSDCAFHNALHPEIPYDSLDPITAPHWRFAQVSKYWNQVALSSTALWGQISLVLDARTAKAKGAKKAMSILQLQLARSKTTPLFASLDANPDTFRKMTEAFKRLLACFMSTSERWESYYYNATPRSFACPPSSMRSLKSLFVQPVLDSDSEQTDAFKEATTLSRFGGQISDLELHCIDHTSLIEFTELLPERVSLWRVADGLPLLRLSNFQRLTVKILYGRRLISEPPSDASIFTSLTHLTVVSGQPPGHWDCGGDTHTSSISVFEGLADILRSSNTALIELCLDFTGWTPHYKEHQLSYSSGFLDLLRSSSMTSLECLSFRDVQSDLTQPFLKELANEPPFLPQLGRLEMHDRSRYSIELMGTVQARRRHMSVVQGLEPEEEDRRPAERVVKKKPTPTVRLGSKLLMNQARYY